LKKLHPTRIPELALKRLRLWLTCGLAASLLYSYPCTAGLFNPGTFTLPNGLQVIVLTNSRAPIVKQIIVYKAGSIDEPRGKSGIAHFLEHLMFKGTKNISGKELEKLNNQAGADQNAFTTRDITGYHYEVVKKDLPLVMRLEADRMVNLLIDAKDVEAERPVIIEERRMRVDNEPDGILKEAMVYSFYHHHPYRIPVVGWENEMETLNQADARDFYNKWYAPNNAVLILAGDITLDEAKALVGKYFGPIPSRELPLRDTPIEPDHRGIVQHVEKSSDRVLEPVYYRMYGAPREKESLTAAYALQVFEHILSSGANSLLYDALVTKKKIASNVGASYSDSLARGPASFYLSAQPVIGKTLADVETALLEELKAIQEKGVTQEQVEKAKKRLVAAIDYIRDDSFGPADIFADIVGRGFEIADVEESKDRIAAVTVEDVNAVARSVLSQEDYLTGHLLPEKKKEKTS
jgi:zinc protease